LVTASDTGRVAKRYSDTGMYRLTGGKEDCVFGRWREKGVVGDDDCVEIVG
jgi:hypothetical protein